MRIELGPTSIKKIAFTAKQSANKERSDLNNLSASNAHSIRNGIAE